MELFRSFVLAVVVITLVILALVIVLPPAWKECRYVVRRRRVARELRALAALRAHERGVGARADGADDRGSLRSVRVAQPGRVDRPRDGAGHGLEPPRAATRPPGAATHADVIRLRARINGQSPRPWLVDVHHR